MAGRRSSALEVMLLRNIREAIQTLLIRSIRDSDLANRVDMNGTVASALDFIESVAGLPRPMQFLVDRERAAAELRFAASVGMLKVAEALIVRRQSGLPMETDPEWADLVSIARAAGRMSYRAAILLAERHDVVPHPTRAGGIHGLTKS